MILLFFGNLTEKTPQVNKKIPLPKVGVENWSAKIYFCPFYSLPSKNSKTDISARGGSAFGGLVCSVRQVRMNVRPYGRAYANVWPNKKDFCSGNLQVSIFFGLKKWKAKAFRYKHHLLACLYLILSWWGNWISPHSAIKFVPPLAGQFLNEQNYSLPFLSICVLTNEDAALVSRSTSAEKPLGDHRVAFPPTITKSV